MKAAYIIAIAVAACAVTPALADNPREFLSKALEGDNSEVMLGKLAADRARSDDVRKYGRTLADDHSQARDEVLQVGRRMGLRADRRPSDEARDEYRKLQDMRGREFDREFVSYMIEDHRNDIREFREEAQEGHGPVSALAQRQLPTLEKHLRMAQELAAGRGGRDNQYGRERHDDGGDRDNRDARDQGYGRH